MTSLASCTQLHWYQNKDGKSNFPFKVDYLAPITTKMTPFSGFIWQTPAYFELSWHEVVDDGVDGRVEVAHAVRDDAPVHQEHHHPLVGQGALLQGVVHDVLKNKVINFFPIPHTYLCICKMARLGLFATIFHTTYTAALGFEPTSVSRVAPDWVLWRMLYRLSYSTAAMQ